MAATAETMIELPATGHPRARATATRASATIGSSAAAISVTGVVIRSRPRNQRVQAPVGHHSERAADMGRLAQQHGVAIAALSCRSAEPVALEQDVPLPCRHLAPGTTPGGKSADWRNSSFGKGREQRIAADRLQRAVEADNAIRARSVTGQRHLEAARQRQRSGRWRARASEIKRFEKTGKRTRHARQRQIAPRVAPRVKPCPGRSMAITR
jgi:hypothetical protein